MKKKKNSVYVGEILFIHSVDPFYRILVSQRPVWQLPFVEKQCLCSAHPAHPMDDRADGDCMTD